MKLNLPDFRIVAPRYYPEFISEKTEINESNRHMLKRFAGFEFSCRLGISPISYPCIYAIVEVESEAPQMSFVDIESVTAGKVMDSSSHYVYGDIGQFLVAKLLYPCSTSDIGKTFGMPLYIQDASTSFFKNIGQLEVGDEKVFGKKLNADNTQEIAFL
ncbi:hypothetical protein [Candidatus Endomicrobiellum devescovinae]|jgi:hypothetical protein|uniref:hypothetical protein n=1 Tax=Candidatus Endomicrobiellum devescovinae TaxID=3242322 RepID=UPI002823BD5D|nr:hypothetical protein [Endomicrobium sp.]